MIASLPTSAPVQNCMCSDRTSIVSASVRQLPCLTVRRNAKTSARNVRACWERRQKPSRIATLSVFVCACSPIRQLQRAVCQRSIVAKHANPVRRNNMRSHLPTISTICGILGLVAFGCSSQQQDLTPVLLAHFESYGARLTVTNDLPSLPCKWSLQKDSNGFQCVAWGLPYDRIEGVLLNAFGGQGVPSRNPGGPKSCQFTASTVGVAVITMDRTNSVKIICLRGVTNWDVGNLSR